MPDHDGWEPMSGGSVSTVARKGDVVRRQLTPTSPSIHALLEHLEVQGFDHAPRFLGVEDDYEFLSFVPDELKPPRTWDGSEDRALVRAAEILRSYHDAVESFRWDGYEWMTYFHLHDRGEIITHNDFGVHNCVFVDGLPHGMIDFDEAAPGTREWDLAYTIYMFAPVHAHADFTEAPRKVRLLCDAYGLEDRSTIIDTPSSGSPGYPTSPCNSSTRVARRPRSATKYCRSARPVSNDSPANAAGCRTLSTDIGTPPVSI
jgi:hypothetical protein